MFPFVLLNCRKKRALNKIVWIIIITQLKYTKNILRFKIEMLRNNYQFILLHRIVSLTLALPLILVRVCVGVSWVINRLLWSEDNVKIRNKLRIILFVQTNIRMIVHKTAYTHARIHETHKSCQIRWWCAMAGISHTIRWGRSHSFWFFIPFFHHSTANVSRINITTHVCVCVYWPGKEWKR